MVAKITKLAFCTEEVPTLVGENISPTRDLDLLAIISNHIYTIAACNPFYPNFVKLEGISFHNMDAHWKNQSWNISAADEE